MFYLEKFFPNEINFFSKNFSFSIISLAFQFELIDDIDNNSENTSLQNMANKLQNSLELHNDYR
jgi:hypothetical protein